MSLCTNQCGFAWLGGVGSAWSASALLQERLIISHYLPMIIDLFTILFLLICSIWASVCAWLAVYWSWWLRARCRWFSKLFIVIVIVIVITTTVHKKAIRALSNPAQQQFSGCISGNRICAMFHTVYTQPHNSKKAEEYLKAAYFSNVSGCSLKQSCIAINCSHSTFQ